MASVILFSSAVTDSGIDCSNNSSVRCARLRISKVTVRGTGKPRSGTLFKDVRTAKEVVGKAFTSWILLRMFSTFGNAWNAKGLSVLPGRGDGAVKLVTARSSVEAVMVATVVAEGVFTVAAAGVAESVTARATVAAVMSDISTSVDDCTSDISTYADDFTSNDGTESGGFRPAGA